MLSAVRDIIDVNVIASDFLWYNLVPVQGLDMAGVHSPCIMCNLTYFIFMKVELGFLMVGHTHEDIDALFGHISVWLRKHDALTLPGNLNTLNYVLSTHVVLFAYPLL